MSQVRSRRFTSAHVMAACALFISLGGTSYAVTQLPKNSVGSAQVKNGSLTANDLAKGVVTGSRPGPAGARGPRGAEGSAGPAGVAGAVPRVSALPASPRDGQDVYFQSAAMATSGVVWHLTYRADAAGPYKWEFVGGSRLSAVHADGTFVNEFTASTTFTDLASAGPSVSLPLAGDYDIGTEYFAYGGGPQVVALMSYSVGGADAVDADSAQMNVAGPSNQAEHGVRSKRKTIGSPATLTAKYRVSPTSAGAGAQFSGRQLWAIPVRVG